MKKALVALLLAGFVSAALAHPFETQDAGMLGAKRWSVEAVFGLTDTPINNNPDFTIGNVAVYYGVIDMLDVGLSLLSWDVQEGNVQWQPLELFAKLAILKETLSLETTIPLNFTSKWADNVFDIDVRAALSIMMFNANLGFGLFSENRAFTYGLAVVPSIGPAFVGAEITGETSSEWWDMGWGLGAGVDVRHVALTLGVHSSFRERKDQSWSLGVAVRFGGK